MGKPFSGTVLRIRDVYPESRILIFVHPESRIPDLGSLIPDPGSRITDPESWIKQQHQKRRGKILFCPTIFCSHTYHKIVNNFIFEQVIFLNATIRIILLFTQNFFHKAIKIWVWDPGSEIQGQKGTGSGIHGSATCSFSLLAHPEYCRRGSQLAHLNESPPCLQRYG
jgi:hypothetical protein